MLDKIFGQLVQPVVGRDDFIILAEQLFEQGILIGIEVRLRNGFGDPVIQINRAMPSFSPRFS